MAQKQGHFLARKLLVLICGHNIIYSFHSILFLMQNAEATPDFYAAMVTLLSVPKIV